MTLLLVMYIILFKQSEQDHILSQKINDNINIDSTIAGLMNVRVLYC